MTVEAIRAEVAHRLEQAKHYEAAALLPGRTYSKEWCKGAISALSELLQYIDTGKGTIQRSCPRCGRDMTHAQVHVLTKSPQEYATVDEMFAEQALCMNCLMEWKQQKESE